MPRGMRVGHRFRSDGLTLGQNLKSGGLTLGHKILDDVPPSSRGDGTT